MMGVFDKDSDRLFKRLVIENKNRINGIHLETTNGHYLHWFRWYYFQVGLDIKDNGSAGSGSYPYFKTGFNVPRECLSRWLQLAIFDTLYGYLASSYGATINVDLYNLCDEDLDLLCEFSDLVSSSYSSRLSDLQPLSRSLSEFKLVDEIMVKEAKVTSSLTTVDTISKYTTKVEIRDTIFELPVGLWYRVGDSVSLIKQLLLLLINFQIKYGMDSLADTSLDGHLPEICREAVSCYFNE